jgi:uncharacterized protein
VNPARKTAKTVAVIGASSDRRKFGNKALRAFRNRGYTVVPINPREQEIEGERAYPSVIEFSGRIDEATVYVRGDVGIQVLDEIAKKGIRTVWLNPGADDPEVVARARKLGLEPITRCSIRAIGESPGDYF